MRRVRPASGSTDSIVFLIPARNEAENLARLLPLLEAKVYVYDDQSEDGTAEIAAANGANVIRGKELPDGWTGKNHACHRLAQVAAEDSSADWWIFLDADMYPEPGLAPAMSAFLRRARTPVVTGFARGLPGRGIEPFIWPRCPNGKRPQQVHERPVHGVACNYLHRPLAERETQGPNPRRRPHRSPACERGHSGGSR
jgi:glycosyltransferase involved in cell wall biosynthesis